MVTERYQADKIVKKCKDCGETFEMEQKEMDWYRNRDWVLPERCLDCRRKRREYRANCLGVTDPRD